MIRKEAKRLIDEIWYGALNADAWLDTLVALKLIKFDDDPMTAHDRFLDEFAKATSIDDDDELWVHLQTALDNADIKIVDRWEDE